MSALFFRSSERLLVWAARFDRPGYPLRARVLDWIAGRLANLGGALRKS